jgi:hypothetical protein
MLPLEVVGPGSSLSTLLVATAYWRNASRRMSWHRHNDDGNIQLQPDSGGACLRAGGQLMAATVEQLWFSTAMDTKLCDFRINSVSFFS